MPYYRFQKEDIFHNSIKTYPKVRFDVYGGVVYYNGAFKESGSFTGSVPCVPPGHINLYELNVDRSRIGAPSAAEIADPDVELISGFMFKGSDKISYKTVTISDFNQTEYGDKITLSYPLSASITREYYGLGTNLEQQSAENRWQPRRKNIDASLFPEIPNDFEPNGLTVSSSHIDALRSSFDYYTHISPHYAFSASNHVWDFGEYDKGHQEMNVIYVPTIFYGSAIKKGSVSLKWYVSGTLMAECADRERNGELIQVSGSGRPSKTGDTEAEQTAGVVYDSATGSVAGVVLYNEGIISLTGTWSLNDDYTDKFRHEAETIKAAESPKWTYFALGANDLSQSVVQTEDHNISSSFTIEFQGTNKVPVMTLLAHAPKGYLNYSNNPTFISGTFATHAPATATITVDDGDAASGMTEGEKITLISADNTTRVYRLVDEELSTIATGTVLADDSDTGSGETADAGDIAVAIKITGASKDTQNEFLVQLKAAIEHANGHNGKITVSSVPTEADGEQSITLTQAEVGIFGNTSLTTDISQIGFIDVSLITVADGDAASGMTEGQKITLISTDQTTRVYRLVDEELSTIATGTVLSDGSDTGAGTTADDGDISVSIKITGGSKDTQNEFLVQLKAAIEHANGHNGKITVSSVPGEADGNQSIMLTRPVTDPEQDFSINITNDIDEVSYTDDDTEFVGVDNFTGGTTILTGSNIPFIANSSSFKEDDQIKIKNIVSSSYTNHTASLKKETYLSKIGIYDKSMNLIAIAKLANPVKKTEERDLTFKLKLDI